MWSKKKKKRLSMTLLALFSGTSSIRASQSSKVRKKTTTQQRLAAIKKKDTTGIYQTNTMRRISSTGKKKLCTPENVQTNKDEKSPPGTRQTCLGLLLDKCYGVP